MRLRYQPNNQQLKDRFHAVRGFMGKAATGAMNDVAEQIKREGRAAIGAAGFGKKWQNALRVNVYPGKGKVSIGPAALAFHKIPYAGVFERGARISGKPFLWLPLGKVPDRIGGKKLTPRIFAATIGPLHSVERPGKPPLLAAYMRGSPAARPTISRLRAGGALARLGVRARKGGFGGQGVVSVPVFIGIPAVQLRSLFNLHAIFQKARAQLPNYYSRNLAAAPR